MQKGKLLKGHFRYKVSQDGLLDKTTVVCNHCQAEFAYHRSYTSLRYHLKAIHAVKAEQSFEAPRFRQTTLVYGGRVDQQKGKRLVEAIAKWVASACRPINIVEDPGLRDVLRIATNDAAYELPSRRTIRRRIQELYENEREAKETTLRSMPAVAITGDYWTSLGNHSYLGVTVQLIDANWELHSHALSVMKTGSTPKPALNSFCRLLRSGTCRTKSSH